MSLDKSQSSLISFESALLVIDVQERLLDALEDPKTFCCKVDLMQKVAKELDIPVIQSLQCKEKLGKMPPALEVEGAVKFDKRAFDLMAETHIRRYVEAHSAKQWVLIGLEAHICVLQTARSLINIGKQVVVAADSCMSLKACDYVSALAELRAMGARVSTCQTLVFEWLKSIDHPSFSKILPLVHKNTLESKSSELKLAETSCCQEERAKACCSSRSDDCCEDYKSFESEDPFDFDDKSFERAFREFCEEHSRYSCRNSTDKDSNDGYQGCC